METVSDTTITAVLLLAFLSVLSMLLGVTLAIYFGRNDRAISLGIGFSASMMLLISFLELMPAAIAEAGWGSPVSVFVVGMLILAALHWLIPHTHLTEEEGAISDRLVKTAYLVAFGLILHDVPEGFAMANAYIASPSLGVLTALAIALHNIPEEFAMAAPIIMVRRRRFLYVAAFLSGLAEPLGAILGLIAVNFNPLLNPLLMAFAAGAMVFVSVHELVPMARQYHRIDLFMLGALIGVLVYALLILLIPQ